MRILIYGFGPYRQFQENVSETILRRLPKRRWLKKVIFPVLFHKRQFIDAVKKHEPDVILGLGQCSRGRRLRIERRAVNKRRDRRVEKARRIVPEGSARLLTNLKLSLGPKARPSRDAGDYVCNYSMYVILDHLKRRRLPIRYGFIHIPHDYDPESAGRFLRKAIESIESAR